MNFSGWLMASSVVGACATCVLLTWITILHARVDELEGRGIRSVERLDASDRRLTEQLGELRGRLAELADIEGIDDRADALIGELKLAFPDEGKRDHLAN